MHPKSTVAFALLSAAPLVGAVGNVHVINKCNFPIYAATTTNQQGPIRTIHSGESSSEPMVTNPDGGGVSLKISPTPDVGGAILQYEYTMDSNLWYDLSNVNGIPFVGSGFALNPSDPTCQNLACRKGESHCADAYNNPYENAATHMCTIDSDYTLTMCPGEVPSGSKENVAAHKHHHHKGGAAPVAPAPSTSVVNTVAPVPTTSYNNYGAAVPMTTFVTEVYTQTVAARDVEATVAAEQPVRRHMHQHHYHHHGRN